MTNKQMLFGAIVFISMNNFTSSIANSSQQKGFVFNNGTSTRINGNSLLMYLHVDRQQSNPSYVFKHTRVVECSKYKQLQEVGTLGSLEKEQSSKGFGAKTRVDRFEKYAKMNNAIYCYDIEQKLNYFDNLESVGAIIYGTQSVEDCSRFKEYLRQQELAKENSKLQVKVTKEENNQT